MDLSSACTACSPTHDLAHSVLETPQQRLREVTNLVTGNGKESTRPAKSPLIQRRAPNGGATTPSRSTRSANASSPSLSRRNAQQSTPTKSPSLARRVAIATSPTKSPAMRGEPSLSVFALYVIFFRYSRRFHQAAQHMSQELARFAPCPLHLHVPHLVHVPCPRALMPIPHIFSRMDSSCTVFA